MLFILYELTPSLVFMTDCILKTVTVMLAVGRVCGYHLTVADVNVLTFNVVSVNVCEV